MLNSEGIELFLTRLELNYHEQAIRDGPCQPIKMIPEDGAVKFVSPNQ